MGCCSHFELSCRFAPNDCFLGVSITFIRWFMRYFDRTHTHNHKVKIWHNTRLHHVYFRAAGQHVIEEGAGWLTVCALGVNNTHSFLEAMTGGTAAAVPQTRTHTGETAGVTPEEDSTETEHVHTYTHETEKTATHASYRPTTTNMSAKASRNRPKQPPE